MSPTHEADSSALTVSGTPKRSPFRKACSEVRRRDSSPHCRNFINSAMADLQSTSILSTRGGRPVPRSGGDDHQSDGCRSSRRPRWAGPCHRGHGCPGHRRWWRPERGPRRWRETSGACLRRRRIRHRPTGVTGQLRRVVWTARPQVIPWPRDRLGGRTSREPVLPVRRVQCLMGGPHQGRMLAAAGDRPCPQRPLRTGRTATRRVGRR